VIASRLRKNIEIPSVEVSLITSKPLSFENAEGLRGFLGAQFPQEPLFHHHKGDSLVYSYPRVQYKILQGQAWIICLAEGIAVTEMLQSFHSIKLGSQVIRVENIQMTRKESSLGVSVGMIGYSFVTPWLALNEGNYKRYLKSRPFSRKKMLTTILIGNLISMSKGIGFTVPEPIKARIKVREVPTVLKGTPMIGFVGTFSVNFEIPNLWGLGKSVSRGFGTVVRVENGGSIKAQLGSGLKQVQK